MDEWGELQGHGILLIRVNSCPFVVPLQVLLLDHLCYPSFLVPFQGQPFPPPARAELSNGIT